MSNQPAGREGQLRLTFPGHTSGEGQLANVPHLVYNALTKLRDLRGRVRRIAQIPTGGKVGSTEQAKPASPPEVGRSGEKPEPTVQSGWEKVVGVQARRRVFVAELAENGPEG